MKIVIGPGQHDFAMYDNDGDEIKVFVNALDIKLRPSTPAEVTMTLLVDEVVADMSDADIILSAKDHHQRRTHPVKETRPLEVCPS